MINDAIYGSVWLVPAATASYQWSPRPASATGQQPPPPYLDSELGRRGWCLVPTQGCSTPAIQFLWMCASRVSKIREPFQCYHLDGAWEGDINKGRHSSSLIQGEHPGCESRNRLLKLKPDWLSYKSIDLFYFSHLTACLSWEIM